MTPRLSARWSCSSVDDGDQLRKCSSASSWPSCAVRSVSAMDWSVLRQGSSASGPLSFLSSLPPLTHRLCFRHAAFVCLPPHTPLFREDDRALQLYVVLQGGLAVFMRGEEGGAGGGGGEDDAQQLIGCVRRGETVGAIGMLYGSDNMHGDRRSSRQVSAAATAAAAAGQHSGEAKDGAAAAASASDGFLPAVSSHHRYGVSALTTVQTSLAVFDRSALSLLLSPSVGWRPPFLSLFSFLRSHPLLLPLSHFRLLQLAHAVRPMHFSTGEMLQLQGHDSDGIHLLMQGECELIREVERDGGEVEGQTAAAAAAAAAGARRVRDLVLGRAGAGELLGDCCLADGALTASFVSVRASARSCSLFVPKLLFTALMPRSALRTMREMEGRRRQVRQERLQAMLALLTPFVRLREVKKSSRRRSPMLAAYEARDREDRREGHRARERRAKAEMADDGSSSGVVLADAINSQQELGAMAAEKEQRAEATTAAAAAGAAGRMEELQADFQLLMRAKDGNVTRGFGVRKRWRWAISAAVYLLRAGMAFLLSSQPVQDDASQRDEHSAAFASASGGSERERWERQTGMRRRSSTVDGPRPRIRTSLITLRPRHSGVEQSESSAPPSASPAASPPPPPHPAPPPPPRDPHFLHRRSVSVNVALLSKADAAMAHIAQEEETLRRREEEDRQHLVQLMQQVEEEEETPRSAALTTKAADCFTFITATDDVEQAAATVTTAATEGSADRPTADGGQQQQQEQQEAQRQQAGDGERIDADALVPDVLSVKLTEESPAEEEEEEEDRTSLSFLHSRPYSGRHVRLVQPLAHLEQQLETATRVAAPGAHRPQTERLPDATEADSSSAHSALASLWSRPLRAMQSRASARPSPPPPSVTAELELPSPPVSPSPPAGHACMRLSLSSPLSSQESSRLPRRPELLFLDVFVTAFSPPLRSASRVPLASLRAVQLSPSSSFYYLSYYSSLLPTVDVERLVVKQLGAEGWEEAQVRTVDATSVCGAGLQLLWRRGAASLSVAGCWGAEQRLREEEQRQTDVQLQLLRTRDRLLLELRRLQPLEAAAAAADSSWQEETKEQIAQLPSSSASPAATTASSCCSSSLLPPLFPPSRRQRKEASPQWASPFALTEQSRANEKLRRQERQLEGEEAETQRQERRERQAGGEPDAAAILAFGGGIVRRPRLLTAETDVMTRRFDKEKRSMRGLLQQLRRRRQHRGSLPQRL